MKGYKFAIEWIVNNDDTEWLDDDHGSPSVSAALVADIYGKQDDKVKVDLIKFRSKREKTS